MKRTILVSNSSSGSVAAVDDEWLMTALQEGGYPVSHRLSLPDDALPKVAWLADNAIDAVVVLAGDGTVGSLCESLAGWNGDILVLPGGTMNLLSRRLHGEADVTEILGKLSADTVPAVQVPIVRVGDKEIFTGITVGPSTKWGEVREGIRQSDVTALRETVPAAWAETMGDDGVWLRGHEDTVYAGIFVEPFDAENVNIIAFRANNLGDMVGHGLAWIRRDFRTGPRDELGVMTQAAILGDHVHTGILIDGEHDDCNLPLTATAGLSSVRFIRTVQ